MFGTLLKRLAYSKIVFVALIGLLACMCLVVPIITLGQNMLHREKSETAEKKESEDRWLGRIAAIRCNNKI